MRNFIHKGIRHPHDSGACILRTTVFRGKVDRLTFYYEFYRKHIVRGPFVIYRTPYNIESHQLSALDPKTSIYSLYMNVDCLAPVQRSLAAFPREFKP